MARLRHRGPDGPGHWLSSRGQAGLGHARLSIIDLDGGQQPIASEDGSLQIVVNGEFYDHDRIRLELERRGHRFRTDSDSEIALHLYQDRGASCLEQLRGEFAFIVWDEREQLLFAARDRFGIKPLYWTELDGRLLLASEIKALFAAGVPARWDRESVYRRLTGGSSLGPAADRSLFAGICQIPAGHYLVATRQGTRCTRYWDFDYPCEGHERSIIDEAECVAEVRNALLEATRLRLRADVPVGCYLSGGIDSCTVLGLASALSDRPISAFTISFEEERWDEAEVAREMARHVGADFHVFRVADDLRADYFADAVAQNETTIAGNVVAKYVLSERVRDLGFKVVLTGEGSDEIFGGYSAFRRDQQLGDPEAAAREPELGAERPRWRRSWASGAAMTQPGERGALRYVQDRLGFVPSWLRRVPLLHWRMSRVLDADFAAEFAHLNVCQQFLDSLDLDGQVAQRARLHQSLYLWSKSALPNTMLSGLGDRSEMGHSIEGRLPLLDHRLVELVKELPPRMKIRGDVEKYVLREAARPFIPPAVFRRRKHPFVAPPTFGRGRLGTLLQDLLRSASMEALPFFNRGTIAAALSASGSGTRWGPYGLAGSLMTIASLCVLQERYCVAAD